jgi:YafQ family addiction module toxin component
MFSFSISDELKLVLRKLSKKDPKKSMIINKKIREIISCNEVAISHYKDLKNELAGYKRVHISSRFVLFFKVFLKEKHIIFLKFKHHDDAYR